MALTTLNLVIYLFSPVFCTNSYYSGASREACPNDLDSGIWQADHHATNAAGQKVVLRVPVKVQLDLVLNVSKSGSARRN
jgi:hypothetical protein